MIKSEKLIPFITKAVITAFVMMTLKTTHAQTHVFISAIPRSNHLTDFSGTQPASFQYQTMPISVNYALGIEQALFPKFSMQLGFMRNTSKIVSKRYLGSNFDNGEVGHGSSRIRSFPWEVFLNLKQAVYSKNSFDVFVCAGASLILQNPYPAIITTTWLIDNDPIVGRDTVMIIEEGLFRRKDYLPFGIHGQIGISKQFKNNFTVSASVLFYYSKPSNNIVTTIAWENRVYQSRAVQQTYFGGANISISYPIIKAYKLKVFYKK